jgi:hypothetical protein
MTTTNHGLVKTKLCDCKIDLLGLIDARIDNIELWLDSFKHSVKSHTEEDLNDFCNKLAAYRELKELKKDIKRI